MCKWDVLCFCAYERGSEKVGVTGIERRRAKC